MEEEVKNSGYIVLKDVNKVYDNHHHAVFDFNLAIKQHEFIVFVGGSGCGKSTTLRMIAGLEDISSGELYIDGIKANDLSPKDRDVAMVFQNYALFPHMSVYDNIGFGLRMRHYPKAEIDQKVKEVAKILQIEEYLNKKPKELSGGQRQRVALGRAIARKAKVYLMDEPLSNLDAKLRVTMRSEIIKIHRQLEATTIYVTHDQTEAMTMADRIVVMNLGHVQQIGTPKEIYNYPANIFVATFIGSPAMNMLEATYDNGVIKLGDFSIKLSKEEIEKHDNFYKNEIERFKNEIEEYLPDEEVRKNEEARGLRLKFEIEDYIEELRKEKQWKIDLIQKYENLLETKQHDLIFGVRPEDIHLVNEKHEDFTESDVLSLEVNVAELLGHEYYIHANFVERDLIAKIPANKNVSTGDNLGFIFNLDKLKLFDKDTTKRIG